MTDNASNFEVLRRAYRVLKADYEAAEQALAGQRAAHAAALAQNSKLAARAEAAEAALAQLRLEVDQRAQRAGAALRRTAAPAPAAAPPPAAAPSASSAAGAPARAVVAGDSVGSSRGRVWADRVLSGVTLFSEALSTSIESVTELAVPPSLQATLDGQAAAIEAQQDIQFAMEVEIVRLEAALVAAAIETGTREANAAMSTVTVTSTATAMSPGFPAASAHAAAAAELVAEAEAVAPAPAVAAVVAAPEQEVAVAEPVTEPVAVAEPVAEPVPHLPFAFGSEGPPMVTPAGAPMTHQPAFLTDVADITDNTNAPSSPIVTSGETTAAVAELEAAAAVAAAAEAAEAAAQAAAAAAAASPPRRLVAPPPPMTNIHFNLPNDEPRTHVRDCDAAYALLLSELSSARGRRLAERAREMELAFTHVPPPPSADASAHPDAVAARSMIAELVELTPAITRTRTAFGSAAVREGLERCLVGRLQRKALGAGADAVEDNVLHAQLATLSFVTPYHVGLPAELCTGPRWAAAHVALRRAAAYSCPLDVMRCVAAACNHLAQLLTLHDAAFVRLAALAVLAARPPLLHSRLEFAARFVHSERLWDGALGGALSIVRAAVQWVAIQDPNTLQA